MATGNSIMFLNITVDDIEDDKQIIELLRRFKTGWNVENLEGRQLVGGNVNKMKMFYQRADVSHDDAVVVRVFSDHLGNITARRTEFQALQIAHASGCFPTIHASFTNGIVYKYAKGRVLNFNDLVKHEVIADITNKLCSLNHIDLESLELLDRGGNPTKNDGKVDALSRMKLFFNKIPTEVEDPDRNDRFQILRQKFTNEMLLKEYEFVKQVYEEVKMPLMFCHGDLHPQNMVINDESNDVMFLDFEMTGFNYGCWDISYLLSMRPFFGAIGWADKSEPDISEATRLLYIKGYLRAMFNRSGKEDDQISDVDIEFMDLQLKFMDLLVYYFIMVVGLSLVVLPGTDFLQLVPVTHEKYMSLKYSIDAMKARYAELKELLNQP